MWIATIVHGISLSRVEPILTSWLQLEGLEGVCLVVAPEDHAMYEPALAARWVPHVRRRYVVTTSPFRRGAWRRLGALCTPTRGMMAFFDADCVPTDRTLLVRAEECLAARDRSFLVFAPAWSRQPEAEAFLTLGSVAALETANQRARGFWAGTVALNRLHAVLVGWDTQLEGWGAEDHAFCQRALTLGFSQETFHGGLVHVWHPSVGEGAHPSPRSLDEKIRNVRELRARATALPEERYQQALDEIFGLRGWLFRSLPEAMVHDADIRMLAFEQAREHQFPLLGKLDAGDVPADAAWSVLREARIVDADQPV